MKRSLNRWQVLTIIVIALLFVLMFGCKTTPPNPPDPPEPSIIVNNGNFGIGHCAAINLKDEYRNQIIPLAKAAGAKYTVLYLSRVSTPHVSGEDYSFKDIDGPFKNHDANQGYDSGWWWRFSTFLKQAKDNGIIVMVSLYDFVNPHVSPFGGFNTVGKEDRDYIAKVVRYLKDSKIKYIINVGVERGYHGVTIPVSFVNDVISRLRKEGVSLNDMCISDELRDDYGSKISPMPRYTTDHHAYIPNGSKKINDEENVGGGGYPNGGGSGWGGSSKTTEYITYLNNVSNEGIAILNFWHLKAFNNNKDAVGGEDMNAIFAPNQRTAMRKVIYNK